MIIPYRIQQRLKRLGVALLVIAVVLAVVLLCWFLWLDRYVVYTRDGAVFDFERSSEELRGEPAIPPGEEDLISIYFNEGEDAVETGTDLSQMIGYYIDYNALLKGTDTIKQQLDALPAGTAVMLEVKSSYGVAFYNSSTIPYRPGSDGVDPAMVDDLIRYMNKKNLYTIAALPSLRDFSYALDHQQIGLDHTGGYLWVDRDNVYWLDPTAEGTVSYLIDIANELRVLGFREVVFLDQTSTAEAVSPERSSHKLKPPQTTSRSTKINIQLLVFTLRHLHCAAFPKAGTSIPKMPQKRNEKRQKI